MYKFIERSNFSAMNLKVYFVCAVLCLSVFIAPTVAARKTSSSSSRRGGSSSSSSSRGSYPKQQPPQYANPNNAQLSYGGNQPVVAAPRPQLNSAPPRPSAPVNADNGPARPIGWNVDSPAVANNKPQVHSNPPYPVNNQPGLGHPAQPPPPPYSPMPGQGPPPAYSQYPNPNVPNRFNEQPPAYSPNQGGGFGAPQPNYPQQPNYGAGAYPQPGPYPQQQQPGGFGAPPQGGFPAGGYNGGVAPGAYPGGYNQPPVVNNYNQKGSGGSGLQTALLAGVGGLALYGALKPSDTKTIIINNTVVQTPENATGIDLATTPVPLAAYPTADNFAQQNASDSAVQSTGSSEMVPLATYSPPSQVPSVSSEPIKLADPIATSTGIYPSLPSEVNTGSGVVIEVTTAVPLAQYPSTINSASSQPQDAIGASTTPNPIALASLNSQSNTQPQESAQKSGAHRHLNTAVTCLSLVLLPTLSRLSIRFF